jgi:hypothetical protein
MPETGTDDRFEFERLLVMVATMDPFIADVIREQVEDLLDLRYQEGLHDGRESMLP